MKLISYLSNNHEEKLALYINDNIVDLEQNAKVIGRNLSSTMNNFLGSGNESLQNAQQVQDAFLSGKTNLIVDSNEDSSPNKFVA